MINLKSQMSKQKSLTKHITEAGISTGIKAVAPIVALNAVGFTSGGIAAGSMAASMMSSAAVANGGAIAAGSAVAALQSLGATIAVFNPLSLTILGISAVATGFLGWLIKKNDD